MNEKIVIQRGKTGTFALIKDVYSYPKLDAISKNWKIDAL